MEGLPKDVIRLWINQHVDAEDYPNLLLTCRLFHALTTDERSEKYRQLLNKRDLSRGFCNRARAQFWRYKRYRRAKDGKLYADLTECPKCQVIVKKRNLHHHRRRCRYREYGPPPCDPFHIVRCWHCGYQTWRYLMWKHVASCQAEMIRCVGCGECKSRREMRAERHPTFPCWDRPECQCKYGCGQRRIGLSREAWAKHERECAENFVECAYCGRQVQRQHLKYHFVQQQQPDFNDLGFTSGGYFFSYRRRVDERNPVATCQSRDGYFWKDLPAIAWGIKENEKV